MGAADIEVDGLIMVTQSNVTTSLDVIKSIRVSQQETDDSSRNTQMIASYMVMSCEMLHRA